MYNIRMTDKNRIQRENAVAEALLGPGKTARNLMRFLISAHESGDGITLERRSFSGEVERYGFLARLDESHTATIDNIMEKAG